MSSLYWAESEPNILLGPRLFSGKTKSEVVTLFLDEPIQDLDIQRHSNLLAEFTFQTYTGTVAS